MYIMYIGQWNSIPLVLINGSFFGHQNAHRIWAKALGDMITNECLKFVTGVLKWQSTKHGTFETSS